MTLTYKDEVAYCRAMGHKTWVKAQHLKKYLLQRMAAENYRGY